MLPVSLCYQLMHRFPGYHLSDVAYSIAYWVLPSPAHVHPVLYWPACVRAWYTNCLHSCPWQIGSSSASWLQCWWIFIQIAWATSWCIEYTAVVSSSCSTCTDLMLVLCCLFSTQLSHCHVHGTFLLNDLKYVVLGIHVFFVSCIIYRLMKMLRLVAESMMLKVLASLFALLQM